MKYNPDYHSSVVDNYKRAFKEKYDKECTISDKDIWKIYEECFCLGDEEVLEEMYENSNKQG